MAIQRLSKRKPNPLPEQVEVNDNNMAVFLRHKLLPVARCYPGT